MAGEITGYQPRAAAGPLVRVPGRGPRSHELRRLTDKWSKARAQERERIEALGARHREYVQALAAHDEALADQDEAALDGTPADAKKVKRLEAKVADAEKQRDAAARRIKAFRPRLEAIEREADHFAQRHAAEISAELLPGIAASERKLREALRAVQAAAGRLDEEVFTVNVVQGTLQAGEPILAGSVDIAQLLGIVGRAQAEPLMRLPQSLVALGGEAGMVTEFEVGDPIPANLPAPGGPVNVNERQAAQAARMAEVAEG